MSRRLHPDTHELLDRDGLDAAWRAAVRAALVGAQRAGSVPEVEGFLEVAGAPAGDDREGRLLDAIAVLSLCRAAAWRPSPARPGETTDTGAPAAPEEKSR